MSNSTSTTQETNPWSHLDEEPKNLPFTLKNPALLRDKSFINNTWVSASSSARFNVLDPGTGEDWASVPDNNADDVNAAVDAAHTAFQSFRKTTARSRAQLLLKWDALIRENKSDIAQLITHETGKPLSESLGELDYSLGFTWWFAGECERISGTISSSSIPGRRIFTTKQPIGVAVALVPWNFPIAMILRKVSAAIAAGCTMIIKPSPETPLSVLALMHLAMEAGFPPGVLGVLTTSLENTPALSEALCRHPDVKKVTFTGSTRVGKLVARICADGLKKCTLELGGNCPLLVFDDANLEQALDALMALKWRHAGQACITANRVYVQSGIYDEFATKLVERTKELKVGHGAHSDTTMGPVTTSRSLLKAQEQVNDALSHGGKLLLGGQKIDNTTGYFFQPTIISNANESMLITHEETFAPVLALYRFPSDAEGGAGGEGEAQVVAAANNTSMGLASYFFTKSIDRSWRLLENLEAGMIGMNTGNSSAAEAPFGGMKESGYGKESGKDVAVNEYLVTKTGTMTVEGHF